MLVVTVIITFDSFDRYVQGCFRHREPVGKHNGLGKPAVLELIFWKGRGTTNQIRTLFNIFDEGALGKEKTAERGNKEFLSRCGGLPL